MTRALVLISAVGLALAVFCFAVASFVGGAPWGPNGAHWRMGPWGHGMHWEVSDDSHGPVVSKDFAWSGGDKLEVDAPADLEYTQGPVTKITVTGAKGLVDRITVQNGRIDLPGSVFNSGPLKVVMTAPNITTFETNGSQDISIAGYKQDQLHIAIHGSGDVTAKGEATHSDLEISGSGDADLGGLTGDEAKVRISGSGDATIAPKTTADVQVSGSGDVTLLTHPANVHSNISGSGSLNQQGDKSNNDKSDDDKDDK